MEWKTGKPTKDGMYYVMFKTMSFADGFNMGSYYEIMTIPFTVENGWCSTPNRKPQLMASWTNIEKWSEVEVVA